MLPGRRRRRRRTQHRCVLPWKLWSIDAPSIAKQIIFCVCSSGFSPSLPPPLATIRWCGCLVFVTLQPSQKLGRKREPLKQRELCGLRSVNGQEEGRRKLVAVQGGGWKLSCALPGGSGKHSPCFVGESQGGELSFSSYLQGLSLKMAIKASNVSGVSGRGEPLSIPHHFTSKSAFLVDLDVEMCYFFPH